MKNRDQLHIQEPEFETSIDSEIRSGLENYTELIKQDLIEKGFSKEEVLPLTQKIQEMSIKVYRIVRALDGQKDLAGFVRDGIWLLRENQTDTIAIRLPTAEGFLQHIKEKIMPKVLTFVAGPEWLGRARQHQRRLSSLEKNIQEEFDHYLLVFSRILKQEPVPVEKWSEVINDWESSDEKISNK